MEDYNINLSGQCSILKVRKNALWTPVTIFLVSSYC